MFNTYDLRLVLLRTNWDAHLYRDPHNDPCKTKMEEETADAAVSVAGFGIFVMLFMVRDEKRRAC